jgi:hypothetical protein
LSPIHKVVTGDPSTPFGIGLAAPGACLMPGCRCPQFRGGQAVTALCGNSFDDGPGRRLCNHPRIDHSTTPTPSPKAAEPGKAPV